MGNDGYERDETSRQGKEEKTRSDQSQLLRFSHTASTPRSNSQLQDTQVDRRVQPQTSLVRSQSRVVLNPVSSVDLELTLVVLPSDSELDDSLGDLDDGEGFTVLGVLGEEGLL
jgi:hypothetical protein